MAFTEKTKRYLAIGGGVAACVVDRTCHVPRPDTGRWGSAGAAILGDEFSLAWRVLDASITRF